MCTHFLSSGGSRVRVRTDGGFAPHQPPKASHRPMPRSTDQHPGGGVRAGAGGRRSLAPAARLRPHHTQEPSADAV